MRVTIVGLGSIGRRHLRNLLAMEHEVSLVSTGKGTLQVEEAAGRRTHRTLEAALEYEVPDAVVIATPTSLHVAGTELALAAGCHVLVEKPLGASLAEVENLTDSRHRSKVLVGFQYRFHPGLLRARQMIEDGGLGRAISARVVWGESLPGWHPWEDFRRSYVARRDLGGGVVHTLSHPFDYLRWLLGEVTAVSAEVTTSTALAVEVDDHADVLLRHEEALSSVHLDLLRQPALHQLEVLFDGGTIVVDCMTADVRWFDAAVGEWNHVSVPGYDRNQDFVAEAAHFTRVVAGVEAPLVSLEDGIRAVAVASAAHKSSQSGTRVEFDV